MYMKAVLVTHVSVNMLFHHVQLMKYNYAYLMCHTFSVCCVWSMWSKYKISQQLMLHLIQSHSLFKFKNILRGPYIKNFDNSIHFEMNLNFSLFLFLLVVLFLLNL